MFVRRRKEDVWRLWRRLSSASPRASSMGTSSTQTLVCDYYYLSLLFCCVLRMVMMNGSPPTNGNDHMVHRDPSIEKARQHHTYQTFNELVAVSSFSSPLVGLLRPTSQILAGHSCCCHQQVARLGGHEKKWRRRYHHKYLRTTARKSQTQGEKLLLSRVHKRW